MTIGKKLVISVGSMLALMAVMGITSLNSIGKLNAELTAATGATARRVKLAAAMDTAGSDMLAAMRGIVMFSLAKDPSKAANSDRQFNAAADTWQKSLDEFRPLIATEEGMRLVNQLQEQLTAWRPVLVDIKQAAARDDESGALAIEVSRGMPIYQANTQATLRLREIQTELMARQQASGASIVLASRWLAIGLLGLGILTGLIVLVLVNRTSRSLQRTAAELGQSAAQVYGAASQISSSSQSLAQGASEQAASIEETSASTEEISAMTRKNAADSQTAAGLMNESSKVVAEANLTLTQMEESMQEINASSEKIGKIIKVIDEIAFQTNILALNAAVEAARAGEAGMGFAVVADEVRSLAHRSAQAAKDTAGMIEESITKSKVGRVNLEGVSKAIHAVTEKDVQVKILIDNLNSSSREQSRGVDEIAKAITQVEKVTQTSAANAEEAASAGEELSSQAGALKEIVGRLEELVGTTAG